jgi:hypothetical protein
MTQHGSPQPFLKGASRSALFALGESTVKRNPHRYQRTVAKTPIFREKNRSPPAGAPAEHNLAEMSQI